MKPLRIPPAALRLLRPLAQAAAERGLPLFAVGGPVRDWILGRGVFDYDLCCDGDAAPLACLCAERIHGTAEAFGQFGTWRVVSKTLRFDLAMCRSENYPEPSALPEVMPAGIEQDLFRRDFTINAMALRLAPDGTTELIDPYGGLNDLRAKVLRTLHPASFRDDPTRVFRAARYLCRFGLKPAPGLVEAARRALDEGHAAKLSRHRLAQELMRILHEKDCAAPLEKTRAWGYLSLLHPGLRPPPPALTGAAERLAAMLAALGKAEGLKLLAALPVEHALSAQIKETLDLAAGGASPRSAVSPLARRVLATLFPKLPPAALKPVLINGRDLQARGLRPGKDFGDILDAAAMLQWKGRLKSRAQALNWLEKTLRNR
ncbi:MAG: CCA tRNA nucleotidyltransferase [Elusimicrobia bacterium]|nr:CCA tRNA nucleotidyltransferase [Elusimicrobiota bacterium]